MNLTLKQKVFAYIQLVRLDKPVGIELLLWATLWGVLLAGVGHSQAQVTLQASTLQATLTDTWQTSSLNTQVNYDPTALIKVFIIFATGAILMRSAGCAINDFADRKVDAHVDRTKGRPLADGRLSGKEAVMTFVILTLLSACLLLFLPIAVFYWSFGAVALAFIYPFMKRYTHLPQIFLASAFAWAIPMSYVAVQGHTDIWCWLVFVAYIGWTVAYDTQYAMTDKADDVKVGIKSTAILFERLFGRYDVLVIAVFQGVYLLLMYVVLWHYFADTTLGYLPMVALSPIIVMFGLQNKKCLTRQPKQCFEAFSANIWVGRYVFLLVLISSLMVIEF